MATATKALALDETLQDVVTELQRITSVSVTADLDDLNNVVITAPANGDALVYDSANSKWKNGAVDVASKANKTDISSIVITGSTNNTGSTIAAGTYFYLNGTLVKSITDISNGATLTLNTNYETANIAEQLKRMTPLLNLDTEYETGEYFMGEKVYTYLWGLGAIASGETYVSLPNAIKNNVAKGVSALAYAPTQNGKLRVLTSVYLSFPEYYDETKIWISSSWAIGNLYIYLKYTKD